MVVLLTGEKDYTKKKDIICLINFLVSYGRPRQRMAELFKRDKSVISRHVSNIFKTGELSREATVAKYATVQREGGRRITRNIEYYNLDVMISVGYRVNSLRGTQFRIWANKILKDYLVKGYALNEKRLQSQIEKYEALKQSIKLVDKGSGTSLNISITQHSQGYLSDSVIELTKQAIQPLQFIRNGSSPS